MPPTLRGHPVSRIGFGSIDSGFMSDAAPGPAVRLFCSRSLSEKHSPRRVVLLDFLLWFLMRAVFALFPSFSNANCPLRGGFAGLVTTVVLFGSAVPAEILSFVSVLSLSLIELSQASIAASVSGE